MVLHNGLGDDLQAAEATDVLHNGPGAELQIADATEATPDKLQTWPRCGVEQQNQDIIKL